MGREARRAPKDFEWPMNKTWWGYLLDNIPCQSCNATGKNSKWDDCATCDGEDHVYPKVECPAKDLTDFKPWMEWPENSWGWQMWETTSEGSPISPVCDTPEALARWLTDNEASTFGPMTATYGQWLAMIGQGSAPSMIFSPETGMISGVEATTELEKD